MLLVADAVTATLLRTAFGVVSERRLAVRAAASGESTMLASVWTIVGAVPTALGSGRLTHDRSWGDIGVTRISGVASYVRVRVIAAAAPTATTITAMITTGCARSARMYAINGLPGRDAGSSGALISDQPWGRFPDRSDRACAAS